MHGPNETKFDWGGCVPRKIHNTLLDHRAHYALTRTHLLNQVVWLSVTSLTEANSHQKPYHSPPCTRVIIISLSCYNRVHLSVTISDRSLTWSEFKKSQAPSSGVFFLTQLFQWPLNGGTLEPQSGMGAGASLDFLTSLCLRSHHLITSHSNITHSLGACNNTLPAHTGHQERPKPQPPHTITFLQAAKVHQSRVPSLNQSCNWDCVFTWKWT